MADYDPARDSYGSWKLGIAAIREQCIRSGQVLPEPDRPEEKAWAAAGPVALDRLETVRRA